MAKGYKDDNRNHKKTLMKQSLKLNGQVLFLVTLTQGYFEEDRKKWIEIMERGFEDDNNDGVVAVAMVGS